jgi:CRISPR-associated protein Cas4
MSSSAPDTVSASPAQFTLELPAPPATAETPLVPVRMVNEYVYCPRLAFLEWVDGEWADSGDTEEGRRAHVRVDAGGGKLPVPGPRKGEDADERPDFAARSVTLASERLGIIARMDLIEGEDGVVTPVDTKKGKRPHVAEGAYEPERVQICAQALILEEAGYRVGEGAIWYARSRERVRAPARRSPSFGSPPRQAGCHHPSSTARNARDARSPASACPTRWRSFAVVWRRARSILPPTQRCRSMCRSLALASASRARRSWWRPKRENPKCRSATSPSWCCTGRFP